MIYYVGDLHGRVEDMMAIDRQAINNGVTCIVQVGDFGIRWPGGTCSMWKYFEKEVESLTHIEHLSGLHVVETMITGINGITYLQSRATLT